jgi:lysozyme
MSTAPSKVPPHLRAGIAALMIAMGGGGAAYMHADRETQALLQNQYVQAVAQDKVATDAVKLAMVMAAYYESSYKHIGTPYVDRLGKGQPLTVCNGITGAAVLRGRYYTPSDCFRLERALYLEYENHMESDVPKWAEHSVWVQASVLDFLHNKGRGAWAGSTMRRKLLAGDSAGACRENPKWARGTVSGVSTVLPGLQMRGLANAEICEKGVQP